MACASTREACIKIHKMAIMKLITSVAALLLLAVAKSDTADQTCSISDPNEVDPALRSFSFDVGDGKKTTMVYVEPDVTTFYEGSELPASTKVVPKFNGFAAKFINLSAKNIRLYWEAHKGARPNLLRYFAPWSTGGTATFPSHRFFFAPEDDPDNRLVEFVVGEYPDNLFIYDPYTVPGNDKETQKNLKKLPRKDKAQYEMWKKTLNFSDQYFNVTGRTYLSNYLRPAPSHHMWRADYFGQEHWVTTKETHFNTLPPAEETPKITVHGKERKLRDDEPRLLSKYRVNEGTMNMTLKVLSCRPRVFEISNFLSQTEIQHILQIADAVELGESTTGDVGSDNSKSVDREEEKRRKTRTSLNSWVPREESPIIDAIYRRAADVLRIDEALLRYRSKGEYDNLPTKKTIAESLQLVHYGVTQEYTAHHDFGYTKVDDINHGARFATLLLYLNEPEEGGETSFPRWVNAESFEQLKVAPEPGKAVLFYSQLPDGNMDDFSQHAALPVTKGEKWLINLWVWDPIYEL